MQGHLKKLHTTLNAPVDYELPLGDQLIPLNPFIGKTIRLVHTGNIVCVHCNKPTKKSFNQGYCYKCFITLAQCDMCIMKPETCHFAAGTCREPVWGEQFCFKPHFVYLANSSGIKVGITRETQLPTRWIDQGAVQALPIFKVASRQISGFVEVVLAKHVSDKTSWQKMLKNDIEPVDLIAKRDELFITCALELEAIKQRFGVNSLMLLPNEPVVDIHFPVDNYPTKIKSFNFDKNPEVTGVLHGIKGQYLLLDTGVINIRKFTGYGVDFFQ
ncbi:DUF2797 domain-containing protein [Crenothrix sp.]|uniref:DUF2797 domain-containing protein n=1 Tax=Crenothrix sp. TaxID=3100433 RepID=UPI00374D7D4E